MTPKLVLERTGEPIVTATFCPEGLQIKETEFRSVQTTPCGTTVAGKVITTIEPAVMGGGWFMVNVYDEIAELVVLFLESEAMSVEDVIRGNIPLVNESIR